VLPGEAQGPFGATQAEIAGAASVVLLGIAPQSLCTSQVAPCATAAKEMSRFMADARCL